MARKQNKSDRSVLQTRFSRHFLSILTIFLLVSILGIYNWITFPTFLGNFIDASSILPLVLKYLDPGLYPGDTELNFFYNYYSIPILWIWAKLYSLTGEFKPIFAILHLFLSFIFLTGVYALAHRISGSAFCSILTVFLSVPARRALGNDNIWGLFIFAESPFAAAFSFAFTPWFVYIFIRFFKIKITLSVIFFLLGLFMIVYPVSSIHLLLLFCLTTIYIEKRITKWVKRLYLPVIWFLSGSIPFLCVNFSSIKSGILLPDSPIQTPLSNEFLIDILPILLIALFACINYPRDEIRVQEKMTLLLLIFAIFLSSTTFIVPYFPWISRFQPHRISQFYFLIPLIFISFYLGQMLKSRSGYRKLLPSLIILIMLFPASYIHPVRIYFEQPEKGALKYNMRGDTNRVFQSRDIEDFKQVCLFCQEKTPKEANFLLPPHPSYTSFRIYAERGIVTSTQDYTQNLRRYNSPTKSRATLYQEIETLLIDFDKDRIRKYARDYNADYIIMEKRKLPLNLLEKLKPDIVFTGDLYIVLKLK